MEISIYLFTYFHLAAEGQQQTDDRNAKNWQEKWAEYQWREPICLH